MDTLQGYLAFARLALVPSTAATPLAEIEARVQQRAKRDAVDLDTADSSEVLAHLVDEEITRWNDEHRDGTRPFPIADPPQVAQRALRNLTGYGPLTPLLNDDDVWEIMINAPDAVFVKRHRGPSGYHDEVFHDDAHVTRILTKILDDSTSSHRKLDPAEGLQDAQLDTGARLHIVHGDIARGGHTIVNIRRFTGVTFHRLDQLVDNAMLTAPAAEFLRSCVRAKQTIVFAGAPGSGKTTMLNCCAAELDPGLRVVTAEEVFEADIAVPNVAAMQTRAARNDRPEVDLRRLVAGFLRMAPDIAIVGEVRDREALPLLLTLSSGVKGFTTIHAGSARQALTRLRFICQLSDTGNELPMTALNHLVSEAIDVIVHCVRSDDGPRVGSIIAVEDLATTDGSSQFTATDVFRREPGRLLRRTPEMPVRLGWAFSDAGLDLGTVLDPGSVQAAR